ncbi:MAG TPA: KpsF/GutQ family sugar-phosphate isomerase [Chthonomonadaceae bacterium]|nr:KpsF/GutQ family sugar-phosphate isomerase [Chthonomonadaceae bacterium]
MNRAVEVPATPRDATEDDGIAFARTTLEIEAAAILRAAERLDTAFERALDLLHGCAGKVVTTGVGKSGMAARKLAATLTSTGCAAVFLHPSEAMHGDLGIVASTDVVIALSNSGESEELLAILPALLARGVPIIAIVGNLGSTLAQKATVVLDAAVEREACPLNLAPTTSVVVALALGDALAMTLQKRRGFRPEDYALNHPGGRLGRRLTLRVRDLMQGGPEALPKVSPEAPLMDVLGEISAKAVGATCVVGEDARLLGIITDYDVRQAFQKFGAQLFAQTAGAIMNRQPAVVLQSDQLAYEALNWMEERPRPISVAPVVDAAGRCVGMLRVHDLVRAGL